MGLRFNAKAIANLNISAGLDIKETMSIGPSQDETLHTM
jgi:hypothetical protein